MLSISGSSPAAKRMFSALLFLFFSLESSMMLGVTASKQSLPADVALFLNSKKFNTCSQKYGTSDFDMASKIVDTFTKVSEFMFNEQIFMSQTSGQTSQQMSQLFQEMTDTMKNKTTSFEDCDFMITTFTQTLDKATKNLRSAASSSKDVAPQILAHCTAFKKVGDYGEENLESIFEKIGKDGEKFKQALKPTIEAYMKMDKKIGELTEENCMTLAKKMKAGGRVFLGREVFN